MKFHVFCTLPNASTLINDVEFAVHDAEAKIMRTAEAVEEKVAEMFRGIAGYKIEAIGTVQKGADWPLADAEIDKLKPAPAFALLKSLDPETTAKTADETKAALKDLAAKARDAKA